MGRDIRSVTIENVIAGIVTYNPDICRLKENLEAISRQVKAIVVVDNGSENVTEIEKTLTEGNSQYSETENLSVYIIQNKQNQGIARALRQIMEYATAQKYKWVLTLDQDSVIEPGLVNEYVKTINDKRYCNAGILTCLIHDRNFKDEKYEKQDAAVIEVPYCITSAAFTSVEKYEKTGGYDKKFFIDCVDFDICYMIRELGYKILRINYNGLYHEVGHGENRRFLWKRIVVYHQKSFRIYYLTRNTVWLHKKHPHTFGAAKMCKKLLALFIRIILYEDERMVKIHSFCKGLKDAGEYKIEA